MRYYTYQDMAAVLGGARSKLPPRLDLIVGIPRSGLAPATMLATMLNAPMADAEGLIEGRLMTFGDTKRRPDVERALGPDRTVLVIDDATESGRAFRKVRSMITEANVPGTIIYGAVYAPVRKHPDVDVVLETVGLDPLFQWNFMHHKVLERACVDIDGVLCANPLAHQDDGGAAYEEFLGAASILHGSSREIAYLVTSRKEKYRAQTEDWLARHHVRYRQLLMLGDDAAAEGLTGPRFKAEVYRKVGAELFIESEEEDAEEIAALSGRPVLAVGAQRLIEPGRRAHRAPMPRKGGAQLRAVSAKAKLKLRNLVGDSAYAAMKSIYRMGAQRP
jgi:uncharacterized HAD superfamily protein/hypoxanthine phosphoribosyltransferase